MRASTAPALLEASYVATTAGETSVVLVTAALRRVDPHAET